MGIFPQISKISRYFGVTNNPSVVARLDIGRPFTLIGTHLIPPIGKAYFDYRNQQFADLSQFVSTRKEPVMILGDLNMTSCSPFFQDFLDKTGFFDSRKRLWYPTVLANKQPYSLGSY